MAIILVIAAHPDDEILGIGGTVLKHKKQGDEVFCIIAAEGIGARYSKGIKRDDEVNELHDQTLEAAKILGYKEVFFLRFPDNRMDSVDLLDVVKKIEEIVNRVNPDIIYTHHEGDLNIDHNVCFRATMVATRPISDKKVKKIYTFETLSSSEWQSKDNHSTFLPNTYINIEKEIDNKIEAMKRYSSELKDYPHPRSIEGIKILSQYRGLESGMKNAEALRLIREIK